ncbi:MAG: LamG domain-containing protein [Myxococcota bacterium]
MRRGAAAAFGAGVAAGLAGVVACSDPVFVCESDAACSGGLCHSGYCAFPDDSCDSGSRWGPHAESLSSLCVPGSGSTGTSSGSVTTGDGPPPASTTGDAVASSGSLADSSSTGSSAATSGSTSSTSAAEETGSTTTGDSGPIPLGHWRLDDKRGPFATDDSPLANHGVLNGGATWTNGAVGGGLALDGIDGYVEVAPLDEYFVEEAFTAAAWIWVEASAPVSHPPILEIRDRVALRLDGTSTAIAGLIGDADALEANPFGNVDCVGDVLPTGEWIHVAATYDVADRALRVYRDAALTCEVTTSGGDGLIDGSPATLYLGLRTTNPGALFNGILDDVRFYDVALTAAELADLIGP